MLAGIHAAIRADLDRLATRIERVVPERTEARALHQAFEETARLIAHHHHSEDEVMWPFFAGRFPAFVRDAELLQHDHVTLEAELARVRAGLHLLASDLIAATRRSTRDRLRSDVQRLTDVVDEHLRREEELVFPLLEAELDEPTASRLEADIMKHAGLGAVSMVLPWVLANARSEQERAIREAAPRALVVIHDLFWRRRFKRRMAPLYTEPAPALPPADRTA